MYINIYHLLSIFPHISLYCSHIYQKVTDLRPKVVLLCEMLKFSMGKSFAVRNGGCRPWAICWTPRCWVWGRRTWRLWVAVLEIRSEWTPAGNMSRKKSDNKPVGLVIWHDLTWVFHATTYSIPCLLLIFQWSFRWNLICSHFWSKWHPEIQLYDQWQSTLPATNASFGSIQGLPRNLQIIKANEHW